jgi:hypothetical protein
MPSKKSRLAQTLERKIYFYRADVGTDDSGMPLPFDPRPALSLVNRLPFTETDGRYLASSDGDAVCCWIDDEGVQPRMRFGLIRRAGLPQIEEAGNLSDLNIATNAGLVEPIHVVFFPENIVGVDFNFYGPRLSRLGLYLHTKCGGQTPCGTFRPIIRNDVVAQLDQLADIRLFALKIHASYTERIKQADEHLAAAFEAARHAGDADEIEIVIQPAKASRSTVMERLIRAAKTLTGYDDLRSESSRFIVKGRRDDIGRVDSIDLLRDHLIAKKQIVRLGGRSRALDMDSAYSAIISAYGELGAELRAAPSVSS